MSFFFAKIKIAKPTLQKPTLFSLFALHFLPSIFQSLSFASFAPFVVFHSLPNPTYSPTSPQSIVSDSLVIR